MRSDPVVLVPPCLDQDLRLEQGVEAFTVEALVSPPDGQGHVATTTAPELVAELVLSFLAEPE